MSSVLRRGRIPHPRRVCEHLDEVCTRLRRVEETVEGAPAAGADGLHFRPTSTDIEQPELLAEAFR